MELITKRFGTEERIEIAEEQIYAFEPGLGGFEELRRYALILDDDSPVEWLQSLEDPDVCFAVMEPFIFLEDYAFELPDSDAEDLGLTRPEDALVRCVLTIREEADEITANLVAPLVLNRGTHLARQIVNEGSKYAMRFQVFDPSTVELAASA